VDRLSNQENNFLTFGWREWVMLPELNLPAIKAKVDTGARTSALHAFAVSPYMQNNIQHVEFKIHPLQGDVETVVTCQAKVIDNRVVTDSGGHKENRWVIESLLSIGDHSWPIEITLTARDNMKFRMLLGRNAIKNRALVDSSKSYLVGTRPRKRKPGGK
jgi:hypothetical protein